MATTATAAPAAAGPRPISRAGPVPWVVTATVVLAWVLTLTLSGSPFGDVVRWSLAVVAAVLAPGFVLVRVSRRAVAPLVEDLSWAGPVGALVALGGWVLDRVLPVSPGAFVVGPVLVAVALAVPWSRARVLARPAPGWGAGPYLVLGLVMLVSLGWMLRTGLQAYRPDPGAEGAAFYPDILYQLVLLGETRHSLVPEYPPVDGTSLSYHWFLHAVTAHLTTHTGVGSFDSTLRLGPATLVPGILMITAVVARRLSGLVWAGPLAAVLLGVSDISQATRWSTEDASIGVLQRVWRASPPQTMGWLVSLAAAGTLVAFLRRSPEDRAVPVALLVPLLVLTAGSKSSQIPVLAAGVALAGAVQLLRRDWWQVRRCIAAGVILLAVFQAASLTLYGSSSYGVRHQWWGLALARVGGLFPGEVQRPSDLALVGLHAPEIAVGTAVVLFVVPLLPRVLGLLLQVRYRPADSGGWMCLGAVVAGTVVAFVIRHPAGSEVYFVQAGYPLAVAGAASGLAVTAALARTATPAVLRGARLGAWLGGLAVTGAVVAAVIAYAQPDLDPVQRWVRDHPDDPGVDALPMRELAWMWLAPLVTLTVAALLLAAAAAAVAFRSAARTRAVDEAAESTGSAAHPPRSGRLALALLSAATLLAGTGLFTAYLQFHGTVRPVQGSVAAVRVPSEQVLAGGQLPLHRDAIAAGRLVEQRADVDDVVATNLYCRFTRAAREDGSPCDARNFVTSALTQRHSLVGGWAYADRVVDSAWELTVPYREAPFWDPALLEAQEAALYDPTSALLDRLHRDHGVRWVFADLRDGDVAVAALDRLAVPRFRGPTTAVWELRTPR